MVQHGDFKHFPGGFAAGDYFGGSFLQGLVAGFDRELRLVDFTGFFASIFCASIEYNGYQTFGFSFGGCGERKIGFHGCHCQYRRRTGN